MLQEGYIRGHGKETTFVIYFVLNQLNPPLGTSITKQKWKYIIYIQSVHRSKHYNCSYINIILFQTKIDRFIYTLHLFINNK